MDKEILVGSRAFFSEFPDFNSKDKDLVKLVDSSPFFKKYGQIHLRNLCCFEFIMTTKEQFIQDALDSELGMTLGKFLVPEFCKEIDFTIEDLPRLRHLVEILDPKHSYEKLIYDFYLENGEMILTKNQLQIVYEEYKKTREAE